MKSIPLARATLLSVAIGLGLAGCGDGRDMSQEEIQYISHLDQARFFQRQGELKASTLEARSAIELQPGNIDPYFVIVNNLLTAGDAVNAERQVNKLIEQQDPDQLTDDVANKAGLIRAESRKMRGQYEDALAALDGLSDPDRSQQLKAALLRGDILLASRRLEDAEEAYQKAAEINSDSVMPLIGLSKLAFARDNVSEARDLVDQAIAIDPEDPELWLWRAQLAHGTQNWAKAEEAYIRALENIGQYDVMTFRKYETISALIRVLRAQAKSAEAFVYEEILAKSAPGTIKSNFDAARQAYQQGDLRDASRYLEEILSQAPQHEQSMLMLGMIRFRQGRTEEAEKLLAPLTQLENTDTTAAKLLAATKIQRRNPEAARKILDNLEGSQTDPGILALVGIAALASGDLSAGEGFIEKALELGPENNNLRVRYARYLLEQNRPQDAIRQAEQAMQHENMGNEARVLIIQSHLAANDLDAAVETASAWVKEEPDNAVAHLTRGQIAMRQNNPDDARQYFRQAAELAPDNPSPRIALGSLARSQNDMKAAVESFRQAVTMAPDNRQALQGLIAVQEQAELEAFLRDLLSRQPEATGPKLVLLELALQNGNDDVADNLTAELLEPLSEEEPARAAPLVAATYNAIASRALQNGNRDRAGALLNRARVLFPEDENTAIQSAALAFMDDRESQALDIIQEAKLAHPDSSRPYITHADYLASEGDHKEAAELYELALNKSRDAGTELKYARSLQQANQRGKAISALEDAIGAFPGSAQLHLNLGLAYQAEERNEEAARAYESVIERAPDNVIALNNLAWLYQEDNGERALELAKRAWTLNPESAAVGDTYGWILFNAGKQEQSLPILEKAHQLRPSAKDIALHLVDAYKATGQDAKAKAILEKM